MAQAIDRAGTRTADDAAERWREPEDAVFDMVRVCYRTLVADPLGRLRK